MIAVYDCMGYLYCKRKYIAVIYLFLFPKGNHLDNLILYWI